MENQKKEEIKFVWEARITLYFKKSSLKLTILCLESTKALAEEKTVEWAKKFVEENQQSVSKKIGYDANLVEEPVVRAYKTSYRAII